jgi:cullin-4
MPSPEDSSVDTIAPLSKSSVKRKLSDEQKKAVASKATRHIPSSIDAPFQSNPPSPKRPKTVHSSGSSGRFEDMNKSKGIGSGPSVIDLTRPSNFRPNTGAKRLVIKNLRTTSRQDSDEYYQRTWNDIDVALTEIFEGKPLPTLPLEILCRGVESTCRHARAEKLYLHYKERCKIYLEKSLAPRILKECGTSNIEALRAVHRFWNVWNKQSVSPCHTAHDELADHIVQELLRSIFSYLDRSFLLNAKDLNQLEDLGIKQFRHALFTKTKGSDGQAFGVKVVAGMCDLVGFDREGQDDLFDADLLRESILMLHIFGTYTKSFEPVFQNRSNEYLKEFASRMTSSSMRDYITSCENLLARETTRCEKYNFDSTTKRSLLDAAHSIIVEQQSDILLDPAGLARIIDDNSMSSLKALYQLLTLSNIQDKLKAPFENYIKTIGSSIISDRQKVDEMVIRLLELKRSLDLIIRDSFKKDESFSYSLREAFGNFINDRKNTAVWGGNTSKVGEMIAKYMDLLLRQGLKGVPQSLAADAKDREASEKQGESSTGDQDAELDWQLEQALELFRFIEGKDVFEAFYKKDLARRLLMARSASQDAERNMLAKLKVECGHSFTYNLEQMFKDQALVTEEMKSYNEWLPSSGKPSLSLSVSVLSAAAWPTYPDVEVTVPIEVARQIERFDKYYKLRHTGRRLTWKHSLAHSVITARFSKGPPKEISVSAFQAIVLLLFNDIDPGEGLSYSSIKATTRLVDAELQRTLQSLACAQFRVLTKHPKGRDVNETDTFTVNMAFTHPKIKFKINQIQLKETKEENQETLERVHQDRQYETQAAIVRIMKSRKTMTHANLVAEVIEQTRKRGAVELGEIKKNIDS